MLMTANIKRSFMSTFTMFHNYRFTNRVKYLTIIHNFKTDLFEDLQMTGLPTLQEQSDLPTLNGLVR